MFRDVPGCSGMFLDVPCSWFYRRPKSFLPKNSIQKHNKRTYKQVRATFKGPCFTTCFGNLPSEERAYFFVHALQRSKTDVIGVCFIFPEFEWVILGSRCTRMLRSIAIKVVSITFHFHCRYTFWLCGTGFICRIFTSYTELNSGEVFSRLLHNNHV